jgi:hypothetical protein
MGFKEDLESKSIVGNFYVCASTGYVYKVTGTFEYEHDRFSEITIPSINGDLYDSTTGRLLVKDQFKFISECSRDTLAPKEFKPEVALIDSSLSLP